METLLEFVKSANGLMWNFLLLVILCGTGIYYTFRLRFIQVRKFGEAFKLVFSNIKLKGEKSKNGEMSSFQALATAIAAQVGTGNLTGAATALIGGGPGAIFWMWLSAFFGMATTYAEATLAQKYKVVENGVTNGGPVYYIKQAFKGKFGKVLAALFAVFIILALGFMGNMVQSNSIGSAFSSVFRARDINIPPIAIGIVLAVIASVIFIGGTTRLASVVEKIVPIMACVYIVGSLVLLIMNIGQVPAAFVTIIKAAFNPRAVLGATAGIGVREAIRYGVARGLFSNEAGMGSTPHAHARAVDTFIILNRTVFSVLTTGAMSSGCDGIELTQYAFVSNFGSWGDIFIAVCLLFFAFSTILSWHFFGKINFEYLFGKKFGIIYSIVVVAFIIIGSTLKLELVWQLSDFFNGLMVIPNALALLALSGVVVKMSKNDKI